MLFLPTNMINKSTKRDLHSKKVATFAYLAGLPHNINVHGSKYMQKNNNNNNITAK